MADEQKKITTEEAFHLVGETLEKVDLSLDNHAAQLANHQETLMAMSTLVDCLRTAVIDLQVRAGLKPHDPSEAN
jgi:hypothetical protein